MKPRIDAEFRDLIPPPTAEELAGLRESLQAEGCRVPLDMWAGFILDGHNRFAICEELGIPYQTHTIELPDRQAAKAWIIRNQLCRRNLTPFQRTKLALLLKPTLEQEAQKKQVLGGKEKVRQNSDEPSRTDEEIAKAANVSRDTVRKVETIEAAAVPEVKKLADAGEVSIHAAAEVAKLPAKEQKKAAAKGAEGIRAAAKKARAKKPTPAPADDQGEGCSDEPAPTDAAGNPIPERPDLRQAFANAAKLQDQALNLLRQVSAIVNELVGKGDTGTPAKGGEWLADNRHRQNVLTDLKNVREALTATRPHAVCPYCGGTNAKCKPCRGAGWVAREIYEQSPKDAREALKAGRSAA